MPAGHTHDRITLWTLPAVTGLVFLLTGGNSELALLVTAGYFFSGLMLSPDLDLRSRPFSRWGWFKWIWVPYQKTIKHRSIFSHGPIIGTTLRVVYLACWLSLVVILGLALVRLFSDFSGTDRLSSLPRFLSQLGRFFRNGALWSYRWQASAFLLGLELGALSHIISDYTVSTYKKYKKSKIKQLHASGLKKRQSPSRQKGRQRK
ncbi:MAG: metal-binding protein [Hormoscilla sp. GM102CHS1]|nr:metal-binding protein [Hormoscilla sp. GM102CHS1]